MCISQCVLPNLQPGATLAGYRIESVVARGGMGVVYRATQLALDRLVALKVIAPEIADDQSFRDRFQRESRLAASIDHPNVIPVHEAGEADGLLFITMRLVDGVDLGRLVASEGPLDDARAARVVSQVADALDAAHARGLVHRDVKPANVLVAGGDHVYLTDFGLVKNVDSESGVTQTGQVVGTVNYSAPEQIGARPVDARTDVYALGCVAFQVLTGSVPFARETPVATMYAHTSDAPPVLGRPAVDAVVARALAKSPDDRFPSAGDFARALTAALKEGTAAVPVPERSVAVGPAAPGGVVATAAASGPTQPLTAPTAQIADSPTPATVAGPGGPDTPTAARAPGFGRRRPEWLVPFLIGLVVVTVSAVVLTFVLGGDSSETHDPLAARTLSVTPIDVEGEPRGAVVGEGGVWLANYANDTVDQIDEGSGRPKGDPVRVGESPTDIAVGDGYVWVVSSSDYTLTRIDPGDREVSGTTIELGIGDNGVAVGEGSVWVANSSDDQVLRIDPASNRVTATIDVPAGVSGDIAVGEGYVWVLGESLEPSLTRIDARTGRVASGGGVVFDGAIAAGEGFGWGYDSDNSAVLRIDPRTQQERGRAEFEGGSGEIEVGAGAVWVLDQQNDRLWRIDPRTGRTRGSDTRVDAEDNSALAIGDDAAWVTQPSAGMVTKIGF
jgi:YVTN family beta-propeller protein